MKSGLKLIALFSFLILSGCRELSFKGSLQVGEVLTVKNTRNKLVPLNPGAYSIDFKVSAKKVEITIPTAQNQKQNITLSIPKGLEIPQNGPFELTSVQSGQPFDLKANVETRISESAPQRDLENCTAQRWENVCAPTGPRGEITCSQRPVTYWGRRSVTFIERQYTRNLKAQWIPKGIDKAVAVSTSQNQEFERIYLQQGACY